MDADQKQALAELDEQIAELEAWVAKRRTERGLPPVPRKVPISAADLAVNVRHSDPEKLKAVADRVQRELEQRLFGELELTAFMNDYFGRTG